MTAWGVIALALWAGGSYLMFTRRRTPRVEWRTRTHVRTIPRPYDHEKELS